jgi:hypothetical protein
MLVALTAGTGMGSGGCGGEGTPNFGDVMLTITVPGDVLVRSAEYTIEGQGRASLSGTILAGAPVHDVDKLIAHVPVGDYVATGRAEATDHLSTCQGTAAVKVMKAATARVHVDASCHGAGHVIVGIGVNCRATALADLLVSPRSARVGESVIARAAGARPEGGALTFAWSAPSGTFSDPSAAQTAFACGAPGPVELTLRVTDSQSCQQTLSALVICLPAPDGGPD